MKDKRELLAVVHALKAGGILPSTPPAQSVTLVCCVSWLRSGDTPCRPGVVQHAAQGFVCKDGPLLKLSGHYTNLP